MVALFRLLILVTICVLNSLLPPSHQLEWGMFPVIISSVLFDDYNLRHLLSSEFYLKG